MALTVTPGGVADDSLATLAQLAAYASSRGYTLAGDSAAQEASLRVGTVFVEGLGGPTARLATRWPGVRTSSAQRRAWPRTGATLTDGTALDPATIPPMIADAVCEAAYREGAAPGLLTKTINLARMVKSAGAGPAKVEFFGGDDVGDMRDTLTAVMDLLSEVLAPDLDGPRFMFRAVGS